MKLCSEVRLDRQQVVAVQAACEATRTAARVEIAGEADADRVDDHAAKDADRLLPIGPHEHRADASIRLAYQSIPLRGLNRSGAGATGEEGSGQDDHQGQCATEFGHGVRRRCAKKTIRSEYRDVFSVTGPNAVNARAPMAPRECVPCCWGAMTSLEYGCTRLHSCRVEPGRVVSSDHDFMCQGK